VTSSFWDTQTSGTLDGFGGIDPDPNGVIGKTTAEMKTKSTFTDAGWDFVGETVNGPNDIWKIVESLDYPRLSWEKYSGGSGKPNDPFRIATADDMILLGDSSGDYDKHFILIADIDLDPNLPGRKIFDKAVIAPDMNDNDDGQFQGTPFSGSFNGNSHVIRNLSITGSEHLGLFGYLVSPSGSVVNVHNLGLEAVDVRGIGDIIGGLAGENKGRIRLCYSTGTVSGTRGDVGGLVGSNNEGDVTQCYSTCLVNGNDSVGGLVGNNYYSGVANCYSTGMVSGTGDNVGGLVGMNIGDATNVTASFWDVETSGQTTSAGGTGKTTVDMWNVQTYQGAGWDFLGEIQDGLHEVWQMPEGGGYPVISIFNGYTPPELQGLGTPENPYLISNSLELGAIFYYRSDSYYRLIADINLADISWGEAVVPQFAGFFDGNDHIVSRLTIQGQYYLGLFGRLESGAELRDLGVVDVNITGSSSWSGGLAGSNNGTVTHCYSTGAVSGVNRIGGLVGMNSGTVTQCYSTGTVDGNDFVGGLAGWSNITVIQCFSKGTVTGKDYVGGLVGLKRGDVTQCYSTCVVIGNYSVGGMLGFNNRGNLTMCYSTGIIIGNDYVGGLVGLNRGGVTQCYSSGTVNGNGGVGGLIGKKDSGNVTDCFWDTQTSGQTISDGGTGKTTTEMKTKSTFTDAGWDFVGETANGPNDIWWINEGKDYPRLSWQGPAGMVFVDIPAGTFEMGDHDGTGRIYDRPVHTVTLDGFQMSRCETTNAQYAAYLNEAMAGGLIQVVSGVVYASADTALAQPYCDTYSSSSDSQIEYNQGQFTVLIREGKDMSDYPVVMVSWYGAKAFCEYYQCRLPTEAQWEYAARGGYHDPYYQYPWGSNSIDCSKANYHSSNGYCNPLNLSIRPWTSPVAYYGSQGAYGLCDMSGNVWEWCQDWFSSTYYKSSPANEPTGPAAGTHCVLRGGSWNGDSNNCRVDYRYWYYPYTRSYHYGFRVCR
jgi:formylglycine-generating enzyme required for sulfatase activity